MRIIALLLTVFSVFGADDPNYAKPFELVYDYDFLCAVRLYADGQLLKEYQTNEIVLIGPAKSNRFANTYAITVPAMARRDEPVTFTCTLFIRNGTNVVESLVNNPLQVSLRPPTPEPLRVYRPIDDDAEIERVATAATLTAMKRHPLWRSMFEQAWDQFDALSHTDVIDAQAVLTIVKRYPANELDNEARLILTQFERGDGVNARAVLRSLVIGIRAGLGDLK